MSAEILTVIVTGALGIITHLVIYYTTRKTIRKDSEYLNKKVEAIKSDFQSINDKNRAQVELLFTTKKELFTDQKRVFLEFWESHYHLQRLCDTTRYEIDEFRIHDFHHLKKQIERQQEKCEIIYTRTHFLIDDNELIILCDNINQICTVNSIKFLSFTDKIEPLLSNAQKALNLEDYKTYQSTNNTIDEHSKEMDDYLDNHDPNQLLNEFKKKTWKIIYNARH